VASVVLDRCAVRFVPRENGVHWVHVQHNGVAIPRSPFRCVVGPRECDVSLVTAHGRGLAAGYVGNSRHLMTRLLYMYVVCPH